MLHVRSPETIPPRWAPVLLALVLPLVLILQAVATLLAVAVIPFFEFTPLVVIVLALASRRWRGVSHRLMRASFWLAVLMSVEWTVWVAWFALTFPAEAIFLRVITGFSIVYLVELLVLMTVFSVAVVRSFVGVRALQSAPSRAKRTATALPMPLSAPVMTAVLPSSSPEETQSSSS